MAKEPPEAIGVCDRLERVTLTPAIEAGRSGTLGQIQLGA